ncbi:hypothetical protein D3C79_771810 [compost metagenome]
MGEGHGVVVQVGKTADFRRVADTAGQHAREVAQLQVPVLVFVTVLKAGAGADAIAHEKRDVVAPAKLRVGFKTKGFERRAQLHVGIGIETITDVAAVDRALAIILEPVADIAEQLFVGGLDIQAERIKEETPVVLGGVPVFIAVVDPQRAADIQRTLAVVTAPGNVREWFFHCWRLVRRRRAGLGSETGGAADDQAQAYHVLVHINAPQG